MRSSRAVRRISKRNELFVSVEVHLRPVIESDLALFENDLESREGAGEFQWFGHASMRGARRNFAETGLLAPSGGTLVVVVDGTPVGRVEWFEARYGRPETSRCWTIAIGLLPEKWGRGIGTAALIALVTYLFAHTRVQRIQAFADIRNIASRTALARAGFLEEGVLRSAQWRDGAWHDQVLYAVVRGDPLHARA